MLADLYKLLVLNIIPQTAERTTAPVPCLNFYAKEKDGKILKVYTELVSEELGQTIFSR